MEVWAYTLISVILVSLIAVIGILSLLWFKGGPKRVSFLLVSFAVGGLFGDAFIHLLPEAFEDFDSDLTAPLLVLVGILVFFVLEKFLRWRHCHLHEPETHIHPVATMNLVGDAVHNLIDGMIIGATYMVSIPLGLTTTLAIVLHEIPQEMGDFGILVHNGLSPRKAIGLNFVSATFAIVGAILSLTIGPHLTGYTAALVPITAGGFIYIAGSDLIPELQHDVKASRSFIQFSMILLGLFLMTLLTILE